MAGFSLTPDLSFNTEPIADPTAFARERRARSWLYLNGEEFATMDGGMSYAQVQEAVAQCARVVSDPPRILDLDLARRHVAALDDLERPTLVTCRAGPRSSAVVYMYAGLKAGADPHDVVAEAERRHAPFCRHEEYKAWVVEAIDSLRGEQSD